jgi:hypothetical protein
VPLFDLNPDQDNNSLISNTYTYVQTSNFKYLANILDELDLLSQWKIAQALAGAEETEMADAAYNKVISMAQQQNLNDPLKSLYLDVSSFMLTNNLPTDRSVDLAKCAIALDETSSRAYHLCQRCN